MARLVFYKKRIQRATKVNSFVKHLLGKYFLMEGAGGRKTPAK